MFLPMKMTWCSTRYFLARQRLPSLTVDASQSQLWNATVDRAGGVASIEQATGATTTMSWTASGGSAAYFWAIGAVPINPAAAGPSPLYGDIEPAPDGDCDVDGSDMAAWIAMGGIDDLALFAENFGMTTCP